MSHVTPGTDIIEPLIGCTPRWPCIQRILQVSQDFSARHLRARFPTSWICLPKARGRQHRVSQGAHTCADQQRCTQVPRLHRPRRRSCTRARSSTLRSDVYLNTFKTRFRFHCVRAPARQAAALLPSPLPANHMAAARHAP